MTNPPPTLRVVSINVGSLLEPNWEKRRVEVVSWLDYLDADIVCLIEVWESDTTPNTAQWLADTCRAEYHLAFGGAAIDPSLLPDPSLRFGKAVLSRWPIESQVTVPLKPIPADQPGGEPEGSFIYLVGWDVLHVTAAGLDIFATHLVGAPNQGLHRQKQVKTIDEYVRSVRGTKDQVTFGQKRTSMPAILAGDFNAEPESDEIRFLSSFTALEGHTTFWQDAWRMAGDSSPGYTQDWRVSPGAASLNVNRKRIDYIFVGDGFQREDSAGRILHTELAFNHPRTDVLASDHFGVVTDIVWPQRPQWET